MAGLFQEAVNKVVASGSSVNDAASIRKRTVAGNLRAQKLMDDMRQNAHAIKIIKKDPDFVDGMSQTN